MRMPHSGYVRFWRWNRTLPLLVLGVVSLICWAMLSAPRNVVRSFLLPVKYEGYITASCARHDVDPYLVCAVIECESGWDASSTSSAGAMGLMQLMPETAESLAALGVVDAWSYDPDNLLDPQTSIEYGCGCLSYLQSEFGATDEVIVAYNAGMGTTQDWLEDEEHITDAIDYPETAIYLQKVKAYRELYEQFYPEGIGEAA